MLILYIPLYWRVPEDGDLSLKHVKGFMFMNDVILYNLLVHINYYKHNAWNE
jgi:hypothetical protein